MSELHAIPGLLSGTFFPATNFADVSASGGSGAIVPLLLASTPWQQCDVMRSGYWTLLVQAIIAGVALSTLVYKKYTDLKERSWGVFLMDVSKQLFASALLYIFNIWYAYLVMNHSTLVRPNPCTWFFLQMAMDTFVGTLFCWILYALAQKCFKGNSEFGFVSGYYGLHATSSYVYQLIVWLCIVSISKMILIALSLGLDKELNTMGEWLMTPLTPFPQLQMLMTMIVIPIFLNVAYYWMNDAVLADDGQAAENIAYLSFTSEYESYYSKLHPLDNTWDLAHNQ